MKRVEALQWMIDALLLERGKPTLASQGIELSEEAAAAKWRGLVNQRPALPISDDFLRVQDEYLLAQRDQSAGYRLEDIEQFRPNIYLFQGDITELRVDGVVNAANSQFLGCFIPNHACLDNILQTKAGVQMRLACQQVKEKLGRRQVPIGMALATPGFNLWAKQVIHVVGPFVDGQVTPFARQQLKKTYESALDLAVGLGLSSVAFPCISTGQFRFPHDEAAKIAVTSVLDYLKKMESSISLVFCCYSEEDAIIYRRLLR